MISSSPVFLILCITITCVAYEDSDIHNNGTSWRSAGRVAGLFLAKCFAVTNRTRPQHSLRVAINCLENGSLVLLDKALNLESIKLASGVELSKIKGPVPAENPELGRSSTTEDNHESGNYLLEKGWKSGVLQRVARLLDTRILRIRLNTLLTDLFQRRGHEDNDSQGRNRRRQSMMMNLMMFGMMTVGVIIVPMGFQFLAVLGGKALLLAKLALLLASIQGLKKIATSNVNYGLYSTPDAYGYGHCKGKLDCMIKKRSDDFNLIGDYSNDSEESDVVFRVDIEDLAHSGTLIGSGLLGATLRMLGLPARFMISSRNINTLILICSTLIVIICTLVSIFAAHIKINRRK